MKNTRAVCLPAGELIWSSASELLRRSVDIILDDGFFFREHRAWHARLARKVDATAKIHFVETPIDIVYARLQSRNAVLPTYNFFVSPEMLRSFAGLFETPP